MKKAICLLLSLLTVLSFCSTALAETIPLYVDIPAENISVTVSTPVGNLTSGSKGTITNNGSGTIQVTSAKIETVDGWELVDFSNGDMPFGSKKFAAQINGADAKNGGDILATFGPIAASTSADYTYKYKTAKWPTEKTKVHVANLVLVFGWVSDTQPTQTKTHKIGDVVDNEAGSWKVIDISDSTVTLFYMKSDEYPEMRAEEITDEINYDSKFANGTSILLSNEMFIYYKDQIISLIDPDTIWWIRENCVLNGAVCGMQDAATYIPIVTVPISSVWNDT